MIWVTRSHVHVDRVACPWLIKRFIDSQAEFLFVPSGRSRRLSKRPAPSRSTRQVWNLDTRMAAVRLNPS
jgi:hypothetical protein